jgi:hypothetical protein
VNPVLLGNVMSFSVLNNHCVLSQLDTITGLKMLHSSTPRSDLYINPHPHMSSTSHPNR